jgi:hypothetical protein
MGSADSTVGLDAVQRPRLFNSRRKTQCSLGTPPLFVEWHLENQRSARIDRRTFTAMRLAVPFEGRPKFHRPCSHGFAPISLDRSIVVLDCQESSPVWRCQIGGDPPFDSVSHWWLKIGLHGRGLHLTVIQPASALPSNPGLSGLLAARITFRLRILQRRGLLQGMSCRHRVVPIVNQLIQRAMEGLPE